MAKRKRQAAKPGTDRYLCPGPVSNVFGVKCGVVAEAMRQAGRTDPLTPAEAKRWRDHPESAPEEAFVILAAVAAAQAEREHHQRQADIEYEHRMMLLTEKVERRLLAGAHDFRNPDAELIASDMAFRAMRELVRRNGDTACLPPSDLAALRWAGVDPADHSTWFLHRGDCEG